MKSIINIKSKYENFESLKGHGQVVNRGSVLGWEMNYSKEDGTSDVKYFRNKTDAKKELKKHLS